jgi:hypothetical protein
MKLSERGKRDEYEGAWKGARAAFEKRTAERDELRESERFAVQRMNKAEEALGNEMFDRASLGEIAAEMRHFAEVTDKVDGLIANALVRQWADRLEALAGGDEE